MLRDVCGMYTFMFTELMLKLVLYSHSYFVLISLFILMPYCIIKGLCKVSLITTAEIRSPQEKI